jgi:Predicted xylanase/chitin deacetylase
MSRTTRFFLGLALCLPSSLAFALHDSTSSAATPPARDPRLWPQGYYSGDSLPERTIYLSFDDGPTDFTAGILDVLEEEGVRATFFLNSYDKDAKGKVDPEDNYLLHYADALKRMVSDGDAIGNHSFSHRDFATLTPAEIRFQLDTLEKRLSEALGGQAPKIRLIRPPFGSPWLGNWNSKAQRRKVADALESRGIVMLWTGGWDSSDSLDWAKGEWYTASAKRFAPGGPGYERKMEREKGRILARADGLASGVVLMHDTHPTSRDVLKSLIDELKARGYEFATLEDYCSWRWGPSVFERFDSGAQDAASFQP